MIKFFYDIVDVSKINRISFRSDINGLRAIAVISVVFYHAEIPYFKGGWLGVDIFFVISGYLISNIIISEFNKGSFSFKAFYERRVRRLLPALIVTLSSSSVLALISFNSFSIQEYAKSLVASMTFLGNFYFSTIDFYTYDPIKYSFLVHTWSLAIEEQFYILFPIVLFFLYKYTKKNIFLFITIFLILSLYLNVLSITNQKFYFLQFRIWEFLVGVGAMILRSKFSIKKIDILGTMLIIFCITYFDDNWISDIEPKLVCLTGAGLILLSDTKNSFVEKFSNIKLISIIGLSSYSMYLFHQPLFAFTRIMSDSLNREFNLYIKILIISILIFLSNLNYKKIEIFFIKDKNPKTLKKFLGNQTVFLLIFILVITITQGFNFLHSEKDLNAEPGNLSFQPDGELLGNVNQEPRFVVIGDSMANHFLKSLNEKAINENFSFYQFTQPNCLSLNNFTNTYKFGIDGYDNCVNLYNKALEKSVNLNIPLIYSNFWEYDLIDNNGEITKWKEREEPFDLLRDELLNSIKSSSNLEIYVIGKTIGSNVLPFGKPVRCMTISDTLHISFYNLTAKDNLGLCNQKTKKTVDNIKFNNEFSKTISGITNLNFINPNDLYCDDKKCFDFISGDYIYWDIHFTYEGSKILVDEIIKRLELSQ